MAKAATADLAQIVKRLHADGVAAVGAFSQLELETIIDDLPLALESESIRDHLPALVARIDGKPKRAFQKIIEIARQDEERASMLLRALRMLRWRGAPSEVQFSWLMEQAKGHSDGELRLAAVERAAALALNEAQASTLDALASAHPDEAIRRQFGKSDHEIVLPNEPLRTLRDYTRFVKSLSAGGALDKLLSANGMNGKQYVACMTAWGRLMHERPDLAVRMGELLRGGVEIQGRVTHGS